METMNFHIGYTNLFCIYGGGGGAINNLAPIKNFPGMQCRLIWMPGKY